MVIKSSKSTINKYTSIRTGETKLGAVIPCLEYDLHQLLDLDSALNHISCHYIILGIPEDIGVRANYGRKGTRYAYDNFLKYFVNIQSNTFLKGNQCYILGEIFVDDLTELSDQSEDIQLWRKFVDEIDNRVSTVIEKIIQKGKTPIIIGGGHNNAYGLIKGTSTAVHHSIEVLNIDPHADFRAMEGRHSGNGFRYAFEENYIEKYGIWGLHEGYNNQAILDGLSDDSKFRYETFEDMILRRGLSFHEFLSFFGSELALELDLDSIKNMNSSAISPIGHSEEDVIRWVVEASLSKKILYYHFCEGIPTENEPYRLGKFLSYIIASILKCSTR